MVVFMTVMCVAMTVVINGITMKYLMQYLKMLDLTPSRKMMVNGSFAKIRSVSAAKKSGLKAEETFFKGVDWGYVERDGIKIDIFHDDIPEEEVPKAAWLSVLSIERASYVEQFHHGTLSPDGFAHLEDFMATILADAAKIPANKPDGRKWEAMRVKPTAKDACAITNALLANGLEEKRFRVGTKWADLGMAGRRTQLHNQALEYLLACKVVSPHSMDTLTLTSEEMDACLPNGCRADDMYVVVDIMLGLQWTELTTEEIEGGDARLRGRRWIDIDNAALAHALSAALVKERAPSRRYSGSSQTPSKRPKGEKSGFARVSVPGSTTADGMPRTVVRFTREQFARFGVKELAHNFKIQVGDVHMRPVDWEEFNTRRFKPCQPDFDFTEKEVKCFGLQDLKTGDYIEVGEHFYKPADRLSNVYDRQFDVLVRQLRKPCSKFSFRERVLAYNIAKAYISGQIAVRHAMSYFHMSLANQNEADSKRKKAHEQANFAMNKVKAEHRDNIEKMADLLASVELHGSSDLTPVRRFKHYKNRYASRLVLLRQQHEIEHLAGEGLIDELDAEPLKETIRKKIEDIELRPLRVWVRNKFIAPFRAGFRALFGLTTSSVHEDIDRHEKPFTLQGALSLLRRVTSRQKTVTVQGRADTADPSPMGKQLQPKPTASPVAAASASAELESVDVQADGK